MQVQRALQFWKTGTYVRPSGVKGNYSADNWGDTHELVTLPGSGRKVVQKTARANLKWHKPVEKARAHLSNVSGT